MIGGLVSLVLLSSPCYQQPVHAAVVDPFRAPACAFCPGNRGLEYRPSVGSSVVAAAPGVVTFSGLVAGVRYLVVAQTDGRTATYGRLAVVRVAVGEAVRSAEPIASTSERFFFGLRVGDRYVDPAPFLGVAHYRRRLVPSDASPPRRAPPPTMRCATSP